MKALEERIQSIADNFPYPPTPPFNWYSMRPKHETKKRFLLRIASLFIMFSCLSIASLPTVRATLDQWIRVGIAYIFPSGETSLSGERPQQLTDFVNEISLAEAHATFPYPFKLPPSQGMPNYIFYEGEGARSRLIFIWVHPQKPDEIALSLMIFGPENYLFKQIYQDSTMSVQINGLSGLWIEEPHLLTLAPQSVFVVPHHVLLWEDGLLTYRLETLLEKEAAIQFAATFDWASNFIGD